MWSRRWEKWYPAVIGIAAAMATLLFALLWRHRIGGNLTELLSATIGVCSIAIGFLATAKSILIAVDDRPIISHLKKQKRYRQFTKSLRFAILLAFALTVLSAMGLLVDFDAMQEWPMWLKVCLSAWVGLSVSTGLACYQVIGLLYQILDYGQDDDG